MPIVYNGHNIPLAKVLRKQATAEEKHLWYDFLVNFPVRFQRQKAIGSYIVDFYCHKAKLVIELDGSQHYTEEGKEADVARDKALCALGLTVLRFTNLQIHNNFHGVCECIDAAVSASLAEVAKRQRGSE